MSWPSFDLTSLRTEDLPRPLRPLHRFYVWASDQVTGHSAHALNGLWAWLAVGGPLWCPLAKWWVLPVIFYTAREIIDYGLSGGKDPLDQLGDVNYVYAYAFALWLPPELGGVFLVWMLWLFVAQAIYWSGSAPEWMPRERLLWGSKERR